MPLPYQKLLVVEMLLHIPTKTYLHIVSISEQHVITEFKIGTGNGQMAKAVTHLVHNYAIAQKEHHSCSFSIKRIAFRSIKQLQVT